MKAISIPKNILEESMQVGDYNDGRMLYEEQEIIAAFIEKYFNGGNTLEIGAYLGRVSYLFAYAHSLITTTDRGRHYIADIFSDSSDSETSFGYREHTADMLKGNLGEYNSDYIITLEGLSLSHKTLEAILKADRYDCIFIDGDHRFPVHYAELLIADTLTDHILVHDYGWSGVTMAVDKFIKWRGYTIKDFNGPTVTSGLREIIKK